MLLSLHIENVAVIKSLNVEFSGGFTALTGETGAGKSILIDSINFLAGARVSREFIRFGEEKASVSAMFSDIGDEACERLSRLGFSPDDDGYLMLSRSMTADGKTQSRIGGALVTASVVKEISPYLINIHGQNENSKLLDEQSYIKMLDEYADTADMISEYGKLYGEMCGARSRAAELKIGADEKARQIENLKYKIAEIEAAKLKDGEEEKLLENRAKLQNIEKISKQSSFAYRALKGGEKANAVYILDRCAAALEQISDVIPNAAELAEKLNGFRFEIDDIAEQVRDFSGGIDGDPTQMLDAVEQRLDIIEKLKRRFAPDIKSILEMCAEDKKRLEALYQSDDEIEKLTAQYNMLFEQCEKQADKLSAARRAAAKKLIPEIKSQLSFLDMEKVDFEIKIEKRVGENKKTELSKLGYDDVVFLISTNPGERPEPVSKIASGGELARIMLALKTVFADRSGTETIIYDEIDTGVSGKTARKIGIRLKESAAGGQIICVTHSAQIASLSDTHMLIKKSEIDGRAQTTLETLSHDGRVSEIARILGGINITDAQRRAALDMIDEYK